MNKPEGENMDKIDNFLSDLAELTKKYGLTIDGCRCCGSPFICSGSYVDCNDLTWNEETQKYTVSK